MVSFDEAYRENQRLKHEAEVNASFKARDQERTKLERENFKMKHPYVMAVVHGVGSAAGSVAKATSEATKNVKAPSIKRSSNKQVSFSGLSKGIDFRVKSKGFF